MGRIHQLPMAVVNRIAAGEVVERPASVVKELLENALDAAPTRVDVALEQGGIALIRVVDDGGGIEAEDLPLAVRAHATSKLRVAEDLERIETLGFRGEALASIAEVSRLVIRSRTPQGPGASITVDGGREEEVRPDGCALGTTVEVHQLFGNVPARRAFLRAPQTEWSHASEAFVRTALAQPGTALSLAHNGRRVHDLPATASWRDRIAALFGADLAARLIEVEADDGEISVHGFVGRPEDDVASGRLQHLFVGGRPFRDRSILHAVQEAYRGLLLGGRQPIAFLAFDLPPEAVDVNVHPAKMEVRFREPSRLYRLVLAALRSKFLAENVATRLEPPRTVAATVPEFAGFAPAAAGAWRLPGMDGSARPASGERPTGAEPPGSPSFAPRWETDPVDDRQAGDERAVQMHDRYIVVETAGGIEVIDQHALHERLLYEKFKASVESGGLEVQPLLVPERVDLHPAELELVTEHSATLERAGMRIEPFGGGTVIVTSKPALAGDTPAATIVREVLDRLSASAAGGRASGILVDEVLHGLACKAAIKAGDRLSQAEVDALVRERRVVPESHHCPHGRPTSLTLSRQDLDRQFRRT
ncbi:MAG: DNA mismatch repair endonuclease MutL [Planctomycetes bacterium]|nr:DNA mismatch repair endonuclease MutL [Planctomycetota bacterium]